MSDKDEMTQPLLLHSSPLIFNSNQYDDGNNNNDGRNNDVMNKEEKDDIEGKGGDVTVHLEEEKRDKEIPNEEGQTQHNLRNDNNSNNNNYSNNGNINHNDDENDENDNDDDDDDEGTVATLISVGHYLQHTIGRLRNRKNILKLFTAFIGVFAVEEFVEESYLHLRNNDRDRHKNPPPNLPPSMLRYDKVMRCASILSGDDDNDMFDNDSPRMRAVLWFLDGSGREVDLPSSNTWEKQCVSGTNFANLYSLVVLRESMKLTTPSWNNADRKVGSVLDICTSWHRVGCDDEKNQITKLHLGNMDIEMTGGTIPHELSNLIYLERFEAYENHNLIGILPSSIGTISRIEYLYLHETSLTGTIPSNFGYLSELRELFLENTELTGSVPGSICKLRKEGKLQLLHIDCKGIVPKMECSLSSCCTNCYTEDRISMKRKGDDNNSIYNKGRVSSESMLQSM